MIQSQNGILEDDNFQNLGESKVQRVGISSLCAQKQGLMKHCVVFQPSTLPNRPASRVNFFSNFKISKMVKDKKCKVKKKKSKSSKEHRTNQLVNSTNRDSKTHFLSKNCLPQKPTLIPEQVSIKFSLTPKKAIQNLLPNVQSVATNSDQLIPEIHQFSINSGHQNTQINQNLKSGAKYNPLQLIKNSTPRTHTPVKTRNIEANTPNAKNPYS